MPSYSRTATLALAFCGTFLNLAAALRLLSLWKSLRWESDSEWEASEKYRLDAVRIVWCLLSAYFSVAAAACLVGLVGVVKRIPAYVRLYRDYSVADLCFCALSTIAFALASFRPGVRAAVCEELSRQPDLMRDLADAGLNLENCEAWFERAVVASVGLMGVLLVVRLQFTLTIANYHTQLLRSTLHTVRLQIVRPSRGPEHAPADPASPHRIYLLPSRPHPAAPPGPANDVLVYAPVPLNSISPEDARELDATEAWLSQSQPPPRPHRSRRHSPSSGPISLPIHRGEPLLPPYTQSIPEEHKH
ncbi:hypothetical protein JB92DRAFT_3081075 [Gautieria morchelliformis]|nr:hypothetical protein JB92DRAFT_3081075 [Gautieria morchelliformis]